MKLFLQRSILFLLLLCLVGCNQPLDQSTLSSTSDMIQGASTPEVQDISTLAVPFDKADSLNPFMLTGQFNKNITSLLYEPLYLLDPHYNAITNIAQTAYNSDFLCTVILKDSLRFSDGTPITAQDVLYSFTLAAKSPAYTSQLASIVSAQIGEDQKSILFTLSNPDILFTNLLTFPIIKTDTGAQEIPIGSGRFAFHEKSNTLQPNPHAMRASGGVKQVSLVEISSREPVATAIRSKVIDYMFTSLLDPVDYAIGSSHKLVSTNSLVYLGINSNRAYLASKEARRGIYVSIDREDIATHSFMGKAVPAYTPFNPAAAWFPDVEFFDNNSNKLAEKLFLEAGMVYTDNRLLWEDMPATLSLLVNSDNEIKLSAANKIKTQLEAIGFTVNIQALPYIEYTSTLRAGNFDLYLGEMKIKDNMDITRLITPGYITSSGVTQDDLLLEHYSNFQKDTTKADSLIIYFSQTVPFVPLVYRHGLIAFGRNFPSNVIATETDIFYNMENWQ